MLRRTFSTLHRRDHKHSTSPSDYHTKLISIAGSLNPSDRSFPWNELSKHAKSILKAHKSSPADELDNYLYEFILRHPRHAVAIASVGHALSRPVAQNLLVALQTDLANGPPFRDFLESLLALSHVRNDVISPEDRRIVPELLRLTKRTQESAIDRDFQWILSLLQPTENRHSGILGSSILTDVVYDLFVREVKLFGERLRNAWVDRKCILAFRRASILANVSVRETQQRESEKLSAPLLLDQHLPNWRAWAAWQPNLANLTVFEAAQRGNATIGDIVELEGPCLVDANLPTKKQRLAVAGNSRFNIGGTTFHFQSNETSQIATLLDILCFALRNVLKSNPREISEKLHFLTFVASNRPITDLDILFLDETIRIQKVSLYSHIRQAIVAMDNKTKIPPNIARDLFQELTETGSENIGPHFKSYLSHELQYSAVLRFQEMQSQFFLDLANRHCWNADEMNLVKELHALGLRLYISDNKETPLAKPLVQLLRRWPRQSEIEIYGLILQQQRKAFPEYHSKFAQTILKYLSFSLMNTEPLPPKALDLLWSLYTLWASRTEDSYRVLSLHVFHLLPGFSVEFRTQCIRRLQSESVEFVAALEAIVLPPKTKNSRARSMIDLAQMMADQHKTEPCWRTVLWRKMDMHKKNLDAWVVSNLSLRQWVQWIATLEIVFVEEISGGQGEDMLLWRKTIHWSREISYLARTIDGVADDMLEGLRALIFNAPEKGHIEELRMIVLHLGLADNPDVKAIMRLLLAELKEDGQNLALVLNSMRSIAQASPNGIEACRHIIQKIKAEQPEVAATYLASWRRDEALGNEDVTLLDNISKVMGLEYLDDIEVNASVLQFTRAQLEERLADLLAEAAQLDEMRKSFKQIDPWGTKSMLAKAGIEDVSIVEDLVANLPPSLLNVWEIISDDALDLHIELDKLQPFKKKRLGFEHTSSIVIRLFPELEELGVPAFCIHPGQDANKYGHKTRHSPCLVFGGSAELEPYECYGELLPGVFQLNRVLWLFLRANGVDSLQAIHDHLVAEIPQLATKCIICMGPLRNQSDRNRSRTCGHRGCKSMLASSELEIDLFDQWDQPEVMDFLLSTVYAATWTNRSNLLNNCPIKDMTQLRNTINSLPAASVLEDYVDDGRYSNAAGLLAWIRSEYQGSLVKASNLEIPLLPGSHQFLLASASPNLEAAFASRVSRGRTQIVFHGTGWDSVYPILCNGLQVMSQTAYQSHGAAMGNGIYVATEPATSAGYAKISQSWSNSKFSNFQVFLGCELAGSWGNPGQGVYVITDAACLMVRFVFLVPNGTGMPTAAQITPAMTKALAELKRGDF